MAAPRDWLLDTNAVSELREGARVLPVDEAMLVTWRCLASEGEKAG